MIYFDPQCLEHFCQLFLFAFTTEKRFDDFQKLTDSPDILSASGFNDDRSQFAAILQLSVQVEEVCKTFFLVSIHDVCCRNSGTLVHTHIQRSVETERKAAFAIIEMMGRYAEVGQDCIYLLDVVITQEILQVTEVAAHEDEVRIVDNVPFSVLVLVESQ